jgi:predicted phosphodiesterase
MEASQANRAPIRRAGVIGDVHAEDERLAGALEWLSGQDVDVILCTGDVADGLGCINRACRQLREADVLTVAGNHDRWLLQDRVRHVVDAHLLTDLDDESRDYLAALPRSRTLDTVAGPLLLCHGVVENDLAKVWPGTERSPIERSKEMDALVAAGSHRFVVNGHMHYRVLIDFESVILVNAGTLRGPFSGVTVVDFEGDYVAAYEPDGTGRAQRVAERELTRNEERRIWRDTQEFDGTWQPVTLHP